MVANFILDPNDPSRFEVTVPPGFSLVAKSDSWLLNRRCSKMVGGARQLHSIALRAKFLSGTRTQSASLIAFGAFAVHELRYLALSGSSSDDELPQQGQSYLAHALPLLAGLLLAVLTAAVVRRLISGSRPTAERRIKATSYALGILAVFCCHELLEGALFAGHAAGLAAILSAGGWAALPVAALFGVLAALIDRGIEAIEHRLIPPAHMQETPVAFAPHGNLVIGPRRLAPLAFGIASRPPPSLRLT